MPIVRSSLLTWFACALLASACAPVDVESPQPAPEDAELGEGAEALTLEEIATGNYDAEFCWKSSYGRGVGTVPDVCPAGTQRDGALCYPMCAGGYYGVGPVCWQACPAGYSDDGAFCRRDAHVMGADNRSCPWYDTCGLTFARGCSKCPAGYVNDGCTCRRDAHIFAKASYGRGAGNSLVCSGGKQYDAGLCYTPCQGGYAGVGPVCWGNCPASLPVACGAGCAETSQACADTVIAQVTSSLELASNIATAVLSFGGSAAARSVFATGLSAAEKAALKAKIKDELRDKARELAEDELETLAEELANASSTGRMDWAALDPTGVSAVVESFYFPECKNVR